MRLIEITRPNIADSAIRLLRVNGYEVLGSGWFATVLAKPNSNWVIKLFKKDEGYLNFLNVIKNNPSKHFPVIKSKPFQVTEFYWGVRLERLQPIPETSQNLINLCYMCASYVQNWTNIRQYEKEILDDKENAEETEPSLSERISRDRQKYQIKEDRKSIEEFQHNHPSLAEALDILIKYIFGPGDSGSDIGIKNCMLRGSTLVLTDPVGFIKLEIPNDLKEPAKQKTLPISQLYSRKPAQPIADVETQFEPEKQLDFGL